MVPSDYAQKGTSYGDSHVQISGNCSPAQWVPQYWCLVSIFSSPSLPVVTTIC
ncbi:hypothetical protein BAUCODRAFT_35566 [Baudoinia panamericana UAMH 10762]|uniref:Uncharacterized protein n=1 Tax=Baudoinia panamericana (strain UAMH 10762) TaxID=717646 RepID=M2LJE6_BAUPA|nr:uncharacterized protein BAUCODRAFT_35566 [Baudoinia panamericana UAMH 10762]EMC94357.1 hypothetical protein BAUCODRAFT_35566 [Baudoinia panamericana UAMH 10762]